MIVTNVSDCHSNTIKTNNLKYQWLCCLISPKCIGKKAFTVRISNTYYLQYLLAVRHCVTHHFTSFHLLVINRAYCKWQSSEREIDRADLLHFFFIQHSFVCREFNVSISITVFFFLLFVTCLLSLGVIERNKLLKLFDCPLSLEVHERKTERKK